MVSWANLSIEPIIGCVLFCHQNKTHPIIGSNTIVSCFQERRLSLPKSASANSLVAAAWAVTCNHSSAALFWHAGNDDLAVSFWQGPARNTHPKVTENEEPPADYAGQDSQLLPESVSLEEIEEGPTALQQSESTERMLEDEKSESELLTQYLKRLLNSESESAMLGMDMIQSTASEAVPMAEEQLASSRFSRDLYALREGF